MSDRGNADRRLSEALERSNAPDPRPLQRENLSRLRDRDPEAFRAAKDYYENVLLPEVAGEAGDPLDAWLAYGLMLAAKLAPGTAVQIDATGLSSPLRRPVPLDHLVLYLPTSTRESVVTVAMPIAMSAAQQATYDLLVLRRVG